MGGEAVEELERAHAQGARALNSIRRLQGFDLLDGAVDPLLGGGSITAGRAETWKAEYDTRVARHRAEIRAETDRLGWSFTIHRTDRPATELLLALHARLGAPPPGAMIGGRLSAANPGRHA